MTNEGLVSAELRWEYTHSRCYILNTSKIRGSEHKHLISLSCYYKSLALTHPTLVYKWFPVRTTLCTNSRGLPGLTSSSAMRMIVSFSPSRTVFAPDTARLLILIFAQRFSCVSGSIVPFPVQDMFLRYFVKRLLWALGQDWIFILGMVRSDEVWLVMKDMLGQQQISHCRWQSG